MEKLNAKKLTRKVFEVIKNNWPIHPSGVCRELDLKINVSNISKIKYHFNILESKNLIHTKKIDRALVAWPKEIEKLRVVHELLRE